MSTRVKLGDVCQIKWGDTSKTKAAYTDEGYPAFSASGRDGYMPHFDHDGPGIVLSAIGAQCGKTWYTDGKWSCIKNTISIRPKQDKADGRYIYYQTQTPDLWPIRGAAQPFISQTDARAVEIDLPDLPTQRRIAGILSAYDDLIENNLRRIRILEEMAQSLYREWFVHFRFPGHESVPLVDSPLGPIPDGWEVKSLGEVGEFRLGKMLDKDKNKGDLMPYLANLNVRWGRFELDDLREMRFTPAELDTYGLKSGDIVMCEGGEPGRCAVWNEQIPGMMFQKAIHRIRCRANMNHSFLYQSLLHLGQGGHLAALFTGATIKHLPREQLAKVRVVVPPQSLLDAFVKFARPVEEQISNLQRRNQALHQTRDLLLPKLLHSGC